MKKKAKPTIKHAVFVWDKKPRGKNNPTDATMRNIRATRAQIKALRAAVRALRIDVRTLFKMVEGLS